MENVKVERVTVTAKPRKLKATWTVDLETDWLRVLLPGDIINVDSGEYTSYPFRANLSDVSMPRVKKIIEWCSETFPTTAYRISGRYNEFLHFAEEKHRTLLILKWS